MIIKGEVETGAGSNFQDPPLSAWNEQCSLLPDQLHSTCAVNQAREQVTIINTHRELNSYIHIPALSQTDLVTLSPGSAEELSPIQAPSAWTTA